MLPPRHCGLLLAGVKGVINRVFAQVIGSALSTRPETEESNTRMRINVPSVTVYCVSSTDFLSCWGLGQVVQGDVPVVGTVCTRLVHVLGWVLNTMEVEVSKSVLPEVEQFQISGGIIYCSWSTVRSIVIPWLCCVVIPWESPWYDLSGWLGVHN